MEAMDPTENPNYDALIKKLGLSKQQLADAAFFTNSKYPNIDLELSVLAPEDIVAGSPAYLQIKLERDADEDETNTSLEPDLTVHAPFYPAKKSENWWVIVGDEKNKTLLAIKRVTIAKKLEMKLEFVVPNPGEHELKCYLMCDSYVGVDQDPSFKVTAAEGMDEDEEGSEEE